MTAVLLKFLFGICALVVALQILSWGFVGGYASGGKVVASHYYVNNKGRMVEVSRNAFEYSLWLDVARDVALLVGILTAAAQYDKDRKAKQERVAAALTRFNSD